MVDRAEAERLLVRYDSLKATYYTMSTGKQQMEEARAAVLAAMTPQWRDTETLRNEIAMHVQLTVALGPEETLSRIMDTIAGYTRAAVLDAAPEVPR